MENKQTAVQWFANQLGITSGTMLEQVKKMEKQQIIDAFDEGQEYEYQYHINGAPKFDSETYFVETYENDETLKDNHIVDATEMAEISDEEIEKAMLDRSGMWDDPLCFEIGWKDAIKWYREQLKKKQ